MKLRSYGIKYAGFFLICMVMLVLSSCAGPPVVPVEQEKKTGIRFPKEVPVKPVVPEQAKERKTLIKVLSEQAEQFVSQENFQDALLVYNQVLALTDEKQKPDVIKKIESVLLKTPAENIEYFSEIKNLTIPESLLRYWMGLNYAAQDNIEKAKEIFEQFLIDYPEHPYHGDVADLLKSIRTAGFQKDTIGCLLPLTGKYSLFGQRALTGIQLAVQEMSRKYSQEFKIKIVDTQADPDLAAMGVRTLYQKNVAAIIGPLLNVEQAGQEAQKLKIPMIALTQKTEFPFSGDYLFSNFINPQMQVQTLGAYIFMELGLEKVAILYPDEKYGRRYMELFWDVVDEYNGKVVGVEAYDGKNTDFTESIQKLTGEFYPVPAVLKPEPEETADEDANPDGLLGQNPDEQDHLVKEKETKAEEEKIEIDFQALFIPDSPAKINMILPQLAFNDATGMYLIGTNLWHDPKILRESKGYNRHAVITDGFFNASRHPRAAEFTKTYESVFEKKPEFLEAISYDTASLLFTFAMDESVDSRQTLKEHLQGTRIFEGVTGSTIFDRAGTAHRQLFLITVKNNRFSEITR